jgi:hypothetical protein
VADGGGLENRYGVTPIKGSNPLPSAKNAFRPAQTLNRVSARRSRPGAIQDHGHEMGTPCSTSGGCACRALAPLPDAAAWS